MDKRRKIAEALLNSSRLVQTEVGFVHYLTNDERAYEKLAFKEISEEHAFYEGEGNRTLEYWREVHKRFFSGELSAVNIPFSEDLLVVCEEFRRVY